MVTKSKGLGCITIRRVEGPAGLETVFPVIRELRTELTFADFVQLVSEAAKRDDYELIAAFESEQCIAAMGFRVLFDLVHGKHLYVDDLVVSAGDRSQGIGTDLLQYAERVAIEKKCKGLRLCTGVDRKDSQRFYERNKWQARAIAYKKKIQEVSA